MTKWIPILEVNSKLLNTIDQIAFRLNSYESDFGAGLIAGDSAAALFFSYYKRFSNREEFSQSAQQKIDEILDRLVNYEGDYDTSFGYGLAGIGWLFQHLLKVNPELDEVEIPDDFRKLIAWSTIESINQKNYDFFVGAVGRALFFYSDSNAEIKNKLLFDFLSRFPELSVRQESNGLSWFSSGDEDCNLGLSHGIASIIVLLSKLLHSGINTANTTRLLDGTITYLLSLQSNRSDSLSVFPNTSESIGYNSRLAWCYGDLGISMALLQAGISSQNENWIRQAMTILRRTTLRTNLEANFVSDPFFCHGAIGIAHIFNRVYQYSKEESFLVSSRYWANIALEMIETQNILSDQSIVAPDLLDGFAGLGLSLIALVSDIEPQWDACLLLS